jgi:hypothetical protein
MQDDLHALLMPFGRRDQYAGRGYGIIGTFIIYEEQPAVETQHLVLLSVLRRPPKQIHRSSPSIVPVRHARYPVGKFVIM